MANSSEPGKQEHPSTYFVKDHANEEELRRLDEQDHLFTAGMGGVLPEQSDPNSFQRILDIGCGPGWWLVETARTYPGIAQLIGMDVSTPMVTFAQARANDSGVGERVTFQTGDALRLLEFPDNYFNLVNQRFAMSFLRKWDWPKILREQQRVCKPGGTIRLTETAFPTSNSAAFNTLFEHFLAAGYNAGNFITPARDGVIRHLADHMQQYGITQVQTKTYTFVYQYSDPVPCQAFIKDMQRAFRLAAPFIRKWTKAPDNYDEIYQQMIHDTQQPDFQGEITLLTAWGIKPRTGLMND